jgi:hypothetical protein
MKKRLLPKIIILRNHWLIFFITEAVINSTQQFDSKVNRRFLNNQPDAPMYSRKLLMMGREDARNM